MVHSSVPHFGIAPRKHRRYSIKDKLSIISDYKEGVNGSGFVALSKTRNVASGTVRGWLQNRHKLKDASKNRLVTTRSARRLGGGGRAPPNYPELEERLHAWILDRNSKGLRVKDNYLRLKAQHFYHDLHGLESSTFHASTGWLVRFKERKQLASRRQTYTQTLPKNAAQICREFVQRVQQLIAVHSIKSHSIVNME
ncbi:Hypothetical protein PHPALM_14599 [Phytophthora palmivora]|uniref:HTH CENPB-type domain-containing protein n=1 Tax=Phytophthora palmivora TaxID=4796 RepID=A0A2P4XUB3_9STRA|nr:Hypothetical protein PHPALM_14599 [Phytophthora palmivora]